jgi:hypothetical protein
VQPFDPIAGINRTRTETLGAKIDEAEVCSTSHATDLLIEAIRILAAQIEWQRARIAALEREQGEAR